MFNRGNTRVDVSSEPGTSGRYPERMIDQLPANYPCAKLKLDQFFLQWLSEHQDLVSTLVEDIQAGRPIHAPTAPVGPSPLSPSTAHMIFASTPPISPSKTRSPGTPLSPARRSTTTLGGSQKRGPLVSIPQFYFPTQSSNAGQGSDPATRDFLQRAEAAYKTDGGAAGLGQKAFVKMMQEVCELPSMVAYSLFKRLTGCEAGEEEGAAVPRDTFIKFWTGRGLVTAPPPKRAFDSLRPDGQDYLTFADFWPMMECVLRYHPGLEFLAETQEFQRKYAETVIHRIFYSLNKCGSGRLTFREFRSGELMDALYALDRENDINKILKFFSYEHFYVIYCKFWELDQDHDFQLDKTDLAHYSNCALSYVIVDRIFEEAPRKFKAGTPPGKMCYEDFVWFILSEEDKTTDTALTYWFRCVDLDGDGVIRPREMLYFYEEQLRRLEGWNQEPVQFEDLLCQLHDMLSPAKEGAFTLRDLKRTKPQSGLFFSSLFSLHKFVGFENRDPFAQRAEAAEFTGLSDWDKFAKIEYFRLASEDDQQDTAGGAMDTDEQI
ncbi:hypothetical protein CHLRE_06g260600v5 [Chlamydomonas reinhardtii]|uniref:EF-hand domain-containing protein n=1 Tax=Chlamydomonas reinhardtii TaxID=3055 RepID=A0A2K3DMN5_CHLRE|nr:uncharacterized protein CHLRE_06g260600v5 [Chlamydomonas reinhardtii]PNW81795.1 hypothetical protein CHLRE_06g260600v5 [Chlamydomonas reinhardtii]